MRKTYRVVHGKVDPAYRERVGHYMLSVSGAAAALIAPWPYSIFGIGLTALAGWSYLFSGRPGVAASRLGEYGAVVDYSDDLIAVVDVDYQYRLANSAFLSRWGNNGAPLIGRQMDQVMGAAVFNELKPHLDAALQGRRSGGVLEIDCPESGPQRMHMHCYPGLDRAGRVNRAVWTARCSPIKPAKEPDESPASKDDWSSDQILVICSYCKKIRSDRGEWRQLEDYLTEKIGLMFSHGICIDCLKREMDELKYRL